MRQPHVGGHPTRSPTPRFGSSHGWLRDHGALTVTPSLPLPQTKESTPQSPLMQKDHHTCIPARLSRPMESLPFPGAAKKERMGNTMGRSKGVNSCGRFWPMRDRRQERAFPPPKLPKKNQIRVPWELQRVSKCLIVLNLSNTLLSFLQGCDEKQMKCHRKQHLERWSIPASLPGDAPQNQACFAVGQWQLWKAPPWICSPSLPSFPLSLTLAF